jgi:hypothetical protein
MLTQLGVYILQLQLKVCEGGRNIQWLSSYAGTYAPLMQGEILMDIHSHTTSHLAFQAPRGGGGDCLYSILIVWP